MIKQKNYNVFPDEVQSFIAEHPAVAEVDMVGMPHRLFADKPFPLTRLGKVDKIELQKLAGPIIEYLREKGKWDAS